ncbi:MAG: undecaprenyl-diphosphate phosphatase, partial [Clostridiales bacterium]|nr:undecaprenyl-diphosphate phosphatase [Clostridiales bacterium]
MSDLIKALILGIIEGITEWLPISSTGHMILAEEFLKFSLSHEFLEMFRVVIQLGAILAVIVLYFHRLNPFSMDGGFHLKKSKVQLWSKIIISCIPAGVIGLLFDDKIDKVFYNYQTVAITLILYGIAFIVIENRNKHMKSTINSLRRLDYRTAFLIGIFQVLALIPGTSRSGANILGGIILGNSRLVAAEFTFFLA